MRFKFTTGPATVEVHVDEGNGDIRFPPGWTKKQTLRDAQIFKLAARELKRALVDIGIERATFYAATGGALGERVAVMCERVKE